MKRRYVIVIIAVVLILGFLYYILTPDGMIAALSVISFISKLGIDTSVIVSFAALLISAYVLWISQLRKFTLDVVPTDRVELTSNSWSKEAEEPSVILQFLFTNKGAKLGYIQDVALVVQKADRGSTPIRYG